MGISLSKHMKYEQQQSGGSYGGSQVLAWLRRLYDWHWELGNCRLDCDLLIVTYALSWCEDTIWHHILVIGDFEIWKNRCCLLSMPPQETRESRGKNSGLVEERTSLQGLCKTFHNCCCDDLTLLSQSLKWAFCLHLLTSCWRSFSEKPKSGCRV